MKKRRLDKMLKSSVAGDYERSIPTERPEIEVCLTFLFYWGFFLNYKASLHNRVLISCVSSLMYGNTRK
jgi:hypothetical protein